MADLGFVHRYVPAKEREARILVLLHGTGGTEQDLIPLAEAILPNAGVLSLRGNVLENGMPRFFRRFAEGVFDLEDLKVRTAELVSFLDKARAHYGLYKNELVAVGYSNGANIASSLTFSYPTYLRAVVLLRAMIPFKPEPVPDLGRLSVLLCEGERDPIVPRTNAVGLADIFKLASANVTLHWHKGGHELGQDDIDAATAWLSKLGDVTDS